jgi:protein-S-isoprenylcysteine O-methyltransferase Ste14
MTQKFFWRLVAGYILGVLIFLFILPFFIFALGSNLTWGLILPPTYRMLIFLVLTGWGIYWVVWANYKLLTEGKGGPAVFWGVAISPPSSVLVKDGPYAIVRHPMVTGMLLFYLGLCFLVNLFLSLVLWIGLVYLVKYYLEHIEEKFLAKQFGTTYLEYQKQAPLLWPWGIKL